MTLSVLRVKNGMRNFFADTVIAAIILEAGDSEAKENSICSRLGAYNLIHSSVLLLTDNSRV